MQRILYSLQQFNQLQQSPVFLIIQMPQIKPSNRFHKCPTQVSCSKDITHRPYFYPLSENAALQRIQLCLDDFQRLKAAFDPLPSLIFPPTPVDIPESPPQLPFGPNEDFLKHQNSITPLMNQMDGIQTGESVVVRRACKRAIDQIIGYDDSLSGYVMTCWEKERGLRLQKRMDSNVSHPGGGIKGDAEGESNTMSAMALADEVVIEIHRKAGITAD